MRTVCKFMSRAKKRQMQKKTIRKRNQVLAESLMSFFVFLVLIFSFLYRAYTYSLFFVYWRVSFTLFTFSIAHSMVTGNTTWLSVSGLFDHSCGDGVQHMADPQNLQDRHRKSEAASYQVLHYSWRYVLGTVSNLKIPNLIAVLSKLLVPRQFTKGCPITN